MGLSWFLVRNFLLCCMVVLVSLTILLNIVTSTKWASFKQNEFSKMFTPAKIILKTTPDKEEPNLIQKITNCTDRPLEPSIEQRGEYWVLFNYVLASKRYKCYESITYTTQGDYTFLDNIIPLVERWKGPISLALHAPGYDFLNTLSSIAYLRNCLKSSHLVKKFVTFHIFFPSNHIPLYSSFKDHEFFLKNMYEDDIDCYKIAPYAKDDYKSLYKTKEKLIYPINVARNIARTNAQTHFVLASDIELYPSLNLIPKFLRMVQRQKQLFEDRQPKVFVLPVFEVLLNESVPNNKTILQTMVKERKAFYFHKRICAPCHSIPNETKWINTNETKNLNVFTKTKREGFYRKWEAFYIGTHEEPLFDERLSWEGQSNKMSQAYAMCLMNYDYVVLDNAFLAHKPGIKNIEFRSIDTVLLLQKRVQSSKITLNHNYNMFMVTMNDVYYKIEINFLNKY